MHHEHHVQKHVILYGFLHNISSGFSSMHTHYKVSLYVATFLSYSLVSQFLISLLFESIATMIQKLIEIKNKYINKSKTKPAC